MPSFLPFGIRKFTEEIFIHPTKKVFRAIVLRFKFNVRDYVNEFSKGRFIKIWLPVYF